MGEITEPRSIEMGGWLDYKPGLRWKYLDRALEAQGTGAMESAVSRTGDTMRRLHGAIVEIGK